MTSNKTPGEPGTEWPPWLQLVDHTADCGIVVHAADLAELFARAAWGMFAIITDPENVKPEFSETLAVTAPDREALLVRWLSELNYRHATRHQLFSRFQVLELDEKRLVAEVSGEEIGPGRHIIHTEIKAVTFHGLRIEPAGGGWRAEIIFDL